MDKQNKRLVKTVFKRILGKEQLRLGLDKKYAEMCGLDFGVECAVTYNMESGIVSVKAKDEVKTKEVKKE